MKKFFEFINEAMSDLDKVLDKMNGHGYDSLNAKEKELLSKFSRGEDISQFKLDDEPRPLIKIPKNKIVKKQVRDNPYNATKFDVGDEVSLAIIDSNGLSEDVYYYLRAQKTFIIRNINANGKIDVGAKTASGASFYLNPSRFKLVKSNSSNPAIKNDVDPFGEENWPDSGGNNNNPNNNNGGNRGGNGNGDDDFPDDDENVNKEDLLLMLCDPLGDNMYGDILIVVIDRNNDGWVYDNNLELDQLFPGLQDIEIDELQEGHLAYYGDMTKLQLADRLRQENFNVRIIEGGINDIHFPVIF